MRKLVPLLMVAGLVAASMIAPAEAAKKKAKKRVVKLAYDHPGIGVAPLGGYPTTFPEAGEIGTTPRDKFMKIEVEDASGQKVWGFISQGDIDGNGINDDGYATFCGAHPEPVPVAEPGTPIIGVYAYSGVCDGGGGASVMTTGTIKITFSATL